MRLQPLGHPSAAPAARERPALGQVGREYRCRPSERKRLGIAALAGSAPEPCSHKDGRPGHSGADRRPTPTASRMAPRWRGRDRARPSAPPHGRVAGDYHVIAGRAASSASRHAAVAAPQSLCIVALRPARRSASGRPRVNFGTDAMLAFFRFLAGTFLLIAVIAAVYDGTRSLAAGGLAMTSLVEHWSDRAGLLNAAQSGVGRATAPAGVGDGLSKLLAVPAWAVRCLGLLFAYAGRRRRRVNVSPTESPTGRRTRDGAHVDVMRLAVPLAKRRLPLARGGRAAEANEVRGAVNTSMAMPPTTSTAMTTTR